MRKMTDFLKDYSFYRETYGSHDPIVSLEDVYISKEQNIYERLGESLPASIVLGKIRSIFKNGWEDNGYVSFSVDQPMNDYFKNALDSILNSSNWSINLKYRTAEDIKKNLKLNKHFITYVLEPRKPGNATDFIYDDCKGIVYKAVSKQSLTKILKNGIKPRKDIKAEYKNLDTDDFRIYVIADKDIDKVKETFTDDIVPTLKSSKLNVGKEWSIVKIDLSKLQKSLDIRLQFFKDTRHEECSFWTMEFIPSFCIEDVSFEFFG